MKYNIVNNVHKSTSTHTHISMHAHTHKLTHNEASNYIQINTNRSCLHPAYQICVP